MSWRKMFRKCMPVVLAVLLAGCSGSSNTQKETERVETSVRDRQSETAVEAITMETEAPAIETEQHTETVAVETEQHTETVAVETEQHTETVVIETEQQTEAAASPFTIFLDDEIYTKPSVNPESDDDVRVYITYNGYPLLDLPFGEEHTVLIHQINGSENLVRLTGEAVYMDSANCDGQDCVNMGEVTRENLETRVLGGFIICLPNMIVVEVRSE